MPQAKGPLEEGTVIFSLVDGIVLASWHGTSSAVPLGDLETVSRVMRDFLAQGEIADRLTRTTARND